MTDSTGNVSTCPTRASTAPLDLITASGLVIDSARSFYLPGPGVTRPWGYPTTGVARRA
ncbi:MAG: hypothetical protein ABIZ07_07900 [Dermatophilaceae bacterium]